jgi:hypothetical protein
VKVDRTNIVHVEGVGECVIILHVAFHQLVVGCNKISVYACIPETR